MEMLLTGDSVDAATAERWGLVNKVVPLAADALMDTALDYARRIAANAPLAVQAAKELAVRSRDVDLATGLRHGAADAAAPARHRRRAEGTAAFAEKRPARFTGT